MKSVKLTNSIREGIIKQLMKLPREKFENRLKELGKLCDSILIKSINKEILEIDKKYPKLINKRNYISFNSISTDEGIYKSIPTSKWYYCYDGENFELLRKNEEIQNFCKQLIFLEKELKTLENKLYCLLYHINTTKQLKDQFPEAYKIFLELSGGIENDSSNLCDSFENIRASLSKFNKK